MSFIAVLQGLHKRKINQLRFKLHYVCDQQVPKGHVWLEGDFPKVSRDSREYGSVPLAMIYGRAWAQVGPIKMLSFLLSYNVV